MQATLLKTRCIFCSRRLSRTEGESILAQETIFGWDARRSAGEASRSLGHEASPDTDAADSGVGGSLKDTLGELALDSSGTAASVSSDGAGDDIKAGAAGAAGGRSKKVSKAAGASCSRDKKSQKEDVTVEGAHKPERLRLNSDSSRSDKRKKTGPDKSSSLEREKKPGLNVMLNKGGEKTGVSGKISPVVGPSSSREKSPEASKRKKHSSTETPALKKSKAPDTSRKDSESQKDHMSSIKDSEVSKKEKTPEISSLKYKTFDKKEKTPEPPKSARGISRLQGFGKETASKNSDKKSKLDVSKIPLDKSISTPAEVALKVSPKVPPKHTKHDLMHQKPNIPQGMKGKSLGKTKAKDDSELNKKDSKISSHVAEIERKSSFRRPKRFDKSMRDSIHLKDKIAPTIQTRTEDRRKKDDKKIEDNPTERPKSWLFENNPFRKQDLVQNSPDKINKFDKPKEPYSFEKECKLSSSPEKRKKSWGTKTNAGTDAVSEDEKPEGKHKDVVAKSKIGKSSENRENECKENSDQSRGKEEKTGKKKGKLSDFPSVSNPNLTLSEKSNGVNSNESTLERRAVKRHRILIEPLTEKLDKIAISVADKVSADSELKTKPKENSEPANSRKIERRPLSDEKKSNAFSCIAKQKPESLVKGSSDRSVNKQSSAVSNGNPKEGLNSDISFGSKSENTKSSVDQNEGKSSAFGATFIKTNPFKLVSFNAAGAENKPSRKIQSPKSDSSENTGESSSSKPPTPTKQKGFSLFRKGSDKRKDSKSPTPDPKSKGLFRRGSDKNKNKSAATQSNHKGSVDKKANSKKPPSPKVDLKAANNADEESISASPRDESDMKILSLIKKGNGATSAGSHLEPPSHSSASPSVSPSLRRRGEPPEQQYKSRFAAMKAMWHKTH